MSASEDMNMDEFAQNPAGNNTEDEIINLKAKVEAVLFITARAMQPAEISELLNIEEDKIENALLELMFDYSSRDGALEIDDEDGYIIQVKEEHLDIVEKLCPVDIKPAVAKTLLIIALKEPIRQSYLKELRSNAYEHIAELLEKGFISRTKDKNGRSYNLKTTPKFAEYFKLKGENNYEQRLKKLHKTTYA